MTSDRAWRVLMIANVIALLAALAFGVDRWITARVAQGVTTYHQNVIQPMMRPAQSPAPAPAR